MPQKAQIYQIARKVVKIAVQEAKFSIDIFHKIAFISKDGLIMEWITQGSS